VGMVLPGMYTPVRGEWGYRDACFISVKDRG
jgi:hypothetical protein